MKINFDKKKNVFIIETRFDENDILTRMPERKFSKALRAWRVPALARNLKYMAENINNSSMYSEEAWGALMSGLDDLESRQRQANRSLEARFPSTYPFKKKPMAHQRRAFDKFYGDDSVALLFEQGLGKTYTSIHLATSWWMSGQIDSVLVLCPSAIKLVWESELSEHSPFDVDTHILQAGKYAPATRFIEYQPKPTDPLRWMVVGIEALSQGRGYDVVRDYVANNKVAIIIDESSKIKTPDKTRTTRCITLGTYARKRVILSGTSITQGVEDWYSQFKFLDPNILGFNSYYTFRDYFCRTMSMEVARNRFVTKIVGYKNEAELIRLVAPYCLRVEKADALDLPEKVFINHMIEPTPQQKRLYDEMAETMAISVGSGYEVSTILEQMLRLQQITGGFYPHDTGVSVVPEPISGKNPKLEHLKELISGLGGKKAVVWCRFRGELALIKSALEADGVSCAEFHGGLNDEQKRMSVEQFRKDPSVQVFISTSAGAYGLTLVEASHAIYYSCGYSLEQYSQSQDRIHRIGQGDKCTYTHLLMANTIDGKVMEALASKQDVATAVYEAVKANSKRNT